jgi:cell division protein FtsN
MKVSPVMMVASALAVFTPGCGTTVEPPAAAKPAPATPRRETSGEVQFHTRADTVIAVGGAEHGTVGSPGKTAQVRFMVQIGAFRDPHHASEVQAAARGRYHMPVLNDYLAGKALYQIRIGFFETRGSARVFQQQMRKEYPADYTDSWIVQLKR